MKVIIYTISGVCKEIILGSNPNIRELRNHICLSLKSYPNDEVRWQDLEIIPRIRNQEGKFIAIGREVSPDEDVMVFLRGELQQPDLKNDELCFSVVKQNMHRFSRTLHNPNGLGTAHIPLIADNPELLDFHLPTDIAKKFMLEASGLREPTALFSERLDKIGVSIIPEKFIDPITLEVMNKPVIASDQRIYDSKTLRIINNISPFTKQKISVICINLKLYSELEFFVSQEEEKVMNLKTDNQTPTRDSEFQRRNSNK